MIKLLPSIYKFIFSSHLAPNYFVMFCNNYYYSQKNFTHQQQQLGKSEREADALLLTQLDIMIIIIKNGGGRE